MTVITSDRIETASAADALDIYGQADCESFNTPFSPTAHPDAQWYPMAGFGLFIHWGVYSQVPTNPSWSMIKNVFGNPGPAKVDPDDYYKLPYSFNPSDYNPDEWLKMAAEMGMKYAVLTTKHHDGFCLWPSAYGEFNTECGAGGRDFVGEFVEACRANGLKAGLYFSPRDWGYNGHKSMFRHPAQKFDWFREPEYPFEGEENLSEYYKWLEYTKGQLAELLTNYGRIDLLWFDGVHWEGVNEPESDRKIRNWIYKLQPHIVINPRWGGELVNPYCSPDGGSESTEKYRRELGDFHTYEFKWEFMENRDPGIYTSMWFEFCQPWKGHFGYVPAQTSEPDIESVKKVIYRLTMIKAFHGNYLLNIGPDGNGNLRPDIIAESAVIADWMKDAGEAFDDTHGVKAWERISGVPLTEKGKCVFAHIPLFENRFSGDFAIVSIDKPLKAEILQTGEKLSFDYLEGSRKGVFYTSDRISGERLGIIIKIYFPEPQNLYKISADTPGSNKEVVEK